jgi:hypothetical protein
MTRVQSGVEFIQFVKGNEYYLFFFTPKNKMAILGTLGRFAANPELSLTWHDASVISKKLRTKVDVVIL